MSVKPGLQVEQTKSQQPSKRPQDRYEKLEQVLNDAQKKTVNLLKYLGYDAGAATKGFENSKGFGTAYYPQEIYSMQVFRPNSLALSYKKLIQEEWIKAGKPEAMLCENEKNDEHKLKEIDWGQLLHHYHSLEQQQIPFRYPGLEMRPIPHTDPRKALRGENGLFLAEGFQLKKHTVLGPYVSLVSFESEYFKATSFVERLEYERYIYAFQSTDDWRPHDDKNQPLSVLVGDAHPCGNIFRAINDFRHDPFNSPLGSPLDGKENCGFVEIKHNGWPFVFVVTYKDVRGGEELLIDYSEKYWEGIIHNQRSCNFRDELCGKIADIHDFLGRHMGPVSQ